MLLALSLAGTALAETPRVRFDVKPIVGCTDVTTPEFAEINPEERLIEVRLEITSLIESGSEKDISQYFYVMEAIDRRTTVSSYLPKTATTSAYDGPISVEHREEDTKHAGVNANGTFDLIVAGTASADVGSKDIFGVKYNLLPPQEQLVASGTTSQGRGVFFKLKPSPQITLEGGREFFLVLRVPAFWRAGQLTVRCETQGVSRGVSPLLDEQDSCGAANFTITLYQEGDLEAKEAATEYAFAAAELVRSVRQHQKDLKQAAYPSVGSRLGAVFGVVEPKLPTNWLQQLLDTPKDQFPAWAPEQLRTAVTRYSTARKHLSSTAR